MKRITELKEIGYKKKRIAELLIEDAARRKLTINAVEYLNSYILDLEIEVKYWITESSLF